MCREQEVCPRGHRALVRECGGVYCLACGYEEVDDPLSLYSDLMSSLPGAPLPTSRGERHDEEVRRGAADAALAREAAKRHGVSLEDLRKRLHWKCTPLSTRIALQDTVYDLTIAGLDIQRVAGALHKSARTIGKSPGLARGRAARKRSPVASAACVGLSPVTSASYEQLRERVREGRGA